MWHVINETLKICVLPKNKQKTHNSPQLNKGPLEKEAKKKVGLPALFTSAKHYFLLITASHSVFLIMFSVQVTKFHFILHSPTWQAVYVYIYPIYKVKFFVIKLLFIFLSENKEGKQLFKNGTHFPIIEIVWSL